MNIAEFHFIRPFWLLSLVPAIIIYILLLKNKLNQGNWSNVCDAELLPFILQERPIEKNRWALFLGGLSSLLIIIALAGPTWERLPSPVFRNAAALVIILDLSQSMDAADIKPNRVTMARYKIADILNQRKDGQTALLVYAGDAFTVTPLTTDTETIANQLSALTTDIIPVQGSNTPLALSIAAKLLKQAGLQSGEILLITDGVDLERSMSKVESLSGYHLSILGVGTESGAPIKKASGGFFKDALGNISIPKLNVSELARLAKAGNGIYKTITNDNSDIEAILSQLQTPTNNENSVDSNLLIDQWNEKGPWLLLIVLPFAALFFRKGLLSLALLCLLPFPKASYALEWNDLWETPDQAAHQAFTQKNYQQAADKFSQPQWKAAAQYKAGQYDKTISTLQNDQSATGLYNLGNALAKSGKLAEAIESYKESLQKDPANEDAKYNIQQVEKELEKQQKNQQQGDKDNKDNKDNKDKDSDSKQSDNKNKSKQEKLEKNSKQNTDSKESEQQPKEKPESDDSKDLKDKAEAKNAKNPESIPPVEKDFEYDESKQADENWLNRIPDDPAGLLKRKFKYQYKQRNQ